MVNAVAEQKEAMALFHQCCQIDRPPFRVLRPFVAEHSPESETSSRGGFFAFPSQEITAFQRRIMTK
jgi:hypothetical protein